MTRVKEVSVIRGKSLNLSLAEELPGEIDVLPCFQCTACSSVCPMSFWGGQIRKFIRKVNLGLEEFYEDESIWQCINCYACVKYCPRSLKPAKLTRHFRVKETQEILGETNPNVTNVFLCRELQEEYGMDQEKEGKKIISTYCASNVTPNLLLNCIKKGVAHLLILGCTTEYECRHEEGRCTGAKQVALTTLLLEQLGLKDLKIEYKETGSKAEAEEAINSM